MTPEPQTVGFHIDLIIGDRAIPFADLTRTRTAGDVSLREAGLRAEYVNALSAGTDPGRARRFIDRDAIRRLDRLRDDITTLIDDITNDTREQEPPR